MRRPPRGWRLLILIVSIFVGHRFIMLSVYMDWPVDERTHVIDNSNRRNTVRMTMVVDNKSLPTTTAMVSMTSDEAKYLAFYRRQTTVVNPFPYVFITSPKAACSDSIFLVIVVHSHPSYRERRDAIRRTWGRYGNGQQAAPHQTRLVFALGVDAKVSANTISAESAIYDDIIQGSFVDAYRNMTLKSLLGLKWVSEQCVRAPYMLKSDDDMFISIPYLIDVLLATHPVRSIMGPYNWHSKVRRRGKWGITKEQFPFKWYPAYESGSCYVITVDIVRELYDTSAYVTPIFIDDVYVTGILGKIIGVKHLKQDGFAYWTDKAPVACDFAMRMKISGTKVTPKLMYALWQELSDLTAEKCRTKKGN